MFKKLITKLFIKMHPDDDIIDSNELRALKSENLDLKATVERFNKELNPFYQSFNYTRIPLTPVCFKVEDRIPSYIKFTGETDLDEYIKKDLTRHFLPEIEKRVIIEKHIDPNGDRVYKAYIRFYEEACIK